MRQGYYARQLRRAHRKRQSLLPFVTFPVHLRTNQNFLRTFSYLLRMLFMRGSARMASSLGNKLRWCDADSASESPLQPAHVAQESRPHHYRSAHAGPRHRRQHRHLHRGLRRRCSRPCPIPSPTSWWLCGRRSRASTTASPPATTPTGSAKAQSFEDLNAWTGGSFNIATKDQPENIDGRTTTPGFYRMLGIPFMMGRDFLPEEGHAGP